MQQSRNWCLGTGVIPPRCCLAPGSFMMFATWYLPQGCQDKVWEGCQHPGVFIIVTSFFRPTYVSVKCQTDLTMDQISAAEKELSGAKREARQKFTERVKEKLLKNDASSTFYTGIFMPLSVSCNAGWGRIALLPF